LGRQEVNPFLIFGEYEMHIDKDLIAQAEETELGRVERKYLSPFLYEGQTNVAVLELIDEHFEQASLDWIALKGSESISTQLVMLYIDGEPVHGLLSYDGGPDYKGPEVELIPKNLLNLVAQIQD